MQKIIGLSVLLAGMVLVAGDVSAQVVLNEVLADNQTSVANVDDYPDYVELFNPSAGTVNLGGMSLSDDPLTPRKFVFPANTLIGPGSYLIVWGDDKTDEPGLHTGFGLNNKGEDLSFYAANGTVADAVSFGLQLPDLAIGRVPNGNGAWTLTIPTPAEANVEQPLGQAASLKINEWMANDVPDPDWLELYNQTNLPVALSGLVLTDSLTPPTNRPIPALSFIEGGGFLQMFADDLDKTGPDHLDFKLSSTSGETLTLYLNDRSTVVDRVTFGPQSQGVSEGRLPDGSTNIVFFTAKDTPEASNFLPLTNVLINEVLTHTDPPMEDAIELYNPTTTPVDMSYWWISNNKDNPQKFQVPPGTVIPAGGYQVFYEYQFNPDRTGDAPSFTLNSAHGDEVYLFTGDPSGRLTGYRAKQDFDAAENGVSFGRFATSVDVDFVAMSQRTFGSDNATTMQEFRRGTGLPNAYPKVGPLVISELMYHPPDILVGTNATDNSDDEFVELHSIVSTNLPLYDPAYPTNTWRLRNGISYDFPTNVALAPHGYLLVVNFDPNTNTTLLAAFRLKYHVPLNVQIFGPYGGKLDNGGESIELKKPDPVQLPPHPDAGFVPFILVDKVKYKDSDPWPASPDGSGQSLQRRVATDYGNEPLNWFGSPPTAGGEGVMDTDGDGMPDAWEQAHGLNAFSSADAGLDSDGDGLTNLQEYQAGTDPQSAQSVLKISHPGSQGGEFSFTAELVEGKSYTVQFREDLANGSWMTLTNLVPNSSGVIQIADPGATDSPSRFYRVVTP